MMLFFLTVTKTRSYIFRNFEEIYGQKVVTALSKVTKMGSTIGHTRDYGRAGLLRGQRPILKKKIDKTLPPPPALFFDDPLMRTINWQISEHEQWILCFSKSLRHAVSYSVHY